MLEGVGSTVENQAVGSKRRYRGNQGNLVILSVIPGYMREVDDWVPPGHEKLGSSFQWLGGLVVGV